MPIPMLDLEAQNAPLREEIRAAMDRVILKNQFILGPDVAAFEKEMTAYLGVRHAIGCANGSDALVLALKALGIGSGDEVVTTTFSFFATAGAIARTGATPVFADVDPHTFNLDPALAEAKMTARTKAIMPVHLYGQMAPMDAFLDIAKRRGVAIVEDAAQAVGSRDRGRAAGTIGSVGTLSFFPSKNLGAFGDAGMCLTNDDQLAERLRSLRVHGTGKERYHYDYIGLNSRLDSVQAAILRVKLPHLERWTEARRKNARLYDERFRGLSGVVTPRVLDGAYHIYNQYTIRVRDRDGLQARLGDAGIGSAVYYPLPLHVQNCFGHLGGKAGDHPHAELASAEAISLPIYGELTEAQIDQIVEVVRLHVSS